jgi:ATP synthase protein I
MPSQADCEDLGDDGFVALSAEQAKKWRQAHPSLSPWWVVAGQLAMGLLVACLAWLLSQRWDVAVSAASGAMAVVLPSALFARGLTGQFARLNPANAVTSFFVWELVKIFVTVAVMLAAHRLVIGLSWPAMLVGLVATMKVYWLALLVKGKRQPVEDQ